MLFVAAVQTLLANARYTRAIDAVAELLARLRVDAIFVGNIARAAWLGGEVESGTIDVLVLMAEPQKNQLAMMASNRGFRVEREELQAADELDLVPIGFRDDEGEVRVFVLLATNALYAKMVTAGRETMFGERLLRVPAPEDLALMLMMAEDDGTLRSLTELPEFDLAAFRERLTSIGLGGRVAAE